MSRSLSKRLDAIERAVGDESRRVVGWVYGPDDRLIGPVEVEASQVIAVELSGVPGPLLLPGPQARSESAESAEVRERMAP